MSDWKPIDTAPKDGTDIIVWAHGRALGARWTDRDRCWRVNILSFVRIDPTHWMPHMPPAARP